MDEDFTYEYRPNTSEANKFAGLAYSASGQFNGTSGCYEMPNISATSNIGTINGVLNLSGREGQKAALEHAIKEAAATFALPNTPGSPLDATGRVGYAPPLGLPQKTLWETAGEVSYAPPLGLPKANASSKAENILLAARTTVMDSGRPVTHGGRQETFTALAKSFTTYLATRKDPSGPIRPKDVAAFMFRVKEVRAEYGQPIFDHFVDMAAYAAIYGELILGEGNATDGEKS